MLRTRLCDLLNIQHPIIQAGMGSGATSAELVAAVSNAGGMGSLATSSRTPDNVRGQLALIRELTDRPYAVNHLVPMLDPEAFAVTLEARPRVVSFALGDPGELVKRVHDIGALVMHQVTTVRQAYEAAERGVDIIIAQGSESGGFGGFVAASVLVPQVVDAVSPVPVVAAGGIADGRGLAAALVWGAQGVNVGTRFIASAESPVSQRWKEAILGAQSEDAVKVEFLDDVLPPVPGVYQAIPRSVRTPFIDGWHRRRSEWHERKKEAQGQVMAAVQQGRGDEVLPFAGQTVGIIHEVLPVAEIMRRMMAEAEEAINKASKLFALGGS